MMEKNSNIYLAGHNGLAGSSILRELEKRNYNKIVYKRSKEFDLRRQTEAETFFESHKPEYVFLAAGKVGGIIANSTYKAQFIYDNIMIAANVINAAYKYGVKKLINLGSSCIYPKLAPQPMKEDYLLAGSLEPTNEAYAIAKIAAIKLCRYYNEQYGTNYISVMPTNLYGINDNFNLETAHVFPSLIRRFHLAKLLRNNSFEEIGKDIEKYSIGFNSDKEINFENEKSIKSVLDKHGINKDYLTIWGSGEPFREFLSVNDFADACVFLMEKYDYKDIGEFVNIGTGRDIKIKDLAGLVKDIIGFDGEIKYDSSKPDGTPKKLLDTSRINALGWKPKVSLKDGIKATYEWYASHGV